MAQRIKGQEVEVIIMVDGQAKTNITTIKNFDFTFQLETTSEGYLGEKTERKDSVFKGIAGKMELHIENQDIFDLVKAAVDKATRRTPGTRINIKATLNFPNGQRPKVIIPDVELGEFPFSFGSRTDYLSVTVNYVAAEAQVIKS
jgi:hypothetical protein